MTTLPHSAPARPGHGATAPFRIVVGTEAPESAGPGAGVHLLTGASTCWSGFLGHFALPHDDALDRLADAIERLESPPAHVTLTGPPAARLLPALWLRTIWLEPGAIVTLRWPRVVPPGADFGEPLAARLCCSIVDEVTCPDDEAALALWGITCGEQAGPALDVFDLGLALVDAWDLRVRWATGAGHAEWLFRAQRAMERCAARGDRRVALYGAGTHTKGLGPVLLAPPVDVVCIIDDHAPAPPAKPSRLWGFPVVTPSAALDHDLDAVILSANAWEDRLWEASAPLRDAGIEVVRLYGTGEDDPA